jgi:hypothetical protein
MEIKGLTDRLLELAERYVAAHERIAEAAERMAFGNEVEVDNRPRRSRPTRIEAIRLPEGAVTEIEKAKAKQAMRRMGMR